MIEFPEALQQRGYSGSLMHYLMKGERYETQTAGYVWAVQKDSKRYIAKQTSDGRRWKKERVLLSRLSHPNVVSVEESFASPEKFPYYIVEPAVGTTNMPIQLYDRRNPLTAAQAATYFSQVAAGLQHCHDNGVCHLDISCSNIRIGDHATLIDFDFAARTGHFTLPKGNAQYFPPMWQHFVVRASPYVDVYNAAALFSHILHSTLWQRTVEHGGLHDTLRSAMTHKISAGDLQKWLEDASVHPSTERLDALLAQPVLQAAALWRSNGSPSKELSDS